MDELSGFSRSVRSFHATSHLLQKPRGLGGMPKLNNIEIGTLRSVEKRSILPAPPAETRNDPPNDRIASEERLEQGFSISAEEFLTSDAAPERADNGAPQHGGEIIV